MNYSPAATEAILKRFRKHSPREFMKNPESYLGPNYAAVINFWTFYDSLNEVQFRKLNLRWGTSIIPSVGTICKAFLNDIGSLFLNQELRYISYFTYVSELGATEELIIMHKLLEKGNCEFPYIKLYDNL